jgi:hypothetical protein
MPRANWVALGLCALVTWNASASSLDTLKKKFHIESDSSSTAASVNATCADGYLTVEGDGNCGYKQKSWSMALGLTTFHPAGVPYWYLDRFGKAAGAFTTSLASVLAWFVSGGMPDGSFKKMATLGFARVAACAEVIWWIVDFVRTGIGDMTDGNGQPLAK